MAFAHSVTRRMWPSALGSSPAGTTTSATVMDHVCGHPSGGSAPRSRILTLASDCARARAANRGTGKPPRVLEIVRRHREVMHRSECRGEDVFVREQLIEQRATT